MLFFKVEDHRNGSYGVTYSPPSAGMHKVGSIHTNYLLLIQLSVGFPEFLVFAVNLIASKMHESLSRSLFAILERVTMG